jgi:hypothetical protein
VRDDGWRHPGGRGGCGADGVDAGDGGSRPVVVVAAPVLVGAGRLEAAVELVDRSSASLGDALLSARRRSSPGVDGTSRPGAAGRDDHGNLGPVLAGAARREPRDAPGALQLQAATGIDRGRRHRRGFMDPSARRAIEAAVQGWRPRGDERAEVAADAIQGQVEDEAASSQGAGVVLVEQAGAGPREEGDAV